MTIRFKSGGLIHDTELCEPQLNLLAHAQAVELDIGSLCGGHGVCGGDRVRVAREELAGFSVPTEAERKHLSAVDLAQGWRLACQCFPERSGLEITLETATR